MGAKGGAPIIYKNLELTKVNISTPIKTSCYTTFFAIASIYLRVFNKKLQLTSAAGKI